MKYISLLAVADFYGSDIKERRGIRTFNYNMTGGQFTANRDYRPFIINTEINDETGEVLKTLTFTETVKKANPIYGCPDEVTVPPIMEIEYMRHEFAEKISTEILDVMEQMAYLYVVYVMMSGGQTDLNRQLEEQGIEELEDIGDALAVMSMQELHEYTMPKYRSYATGILYGTSFVSLFRRCADMSSVFTEFYFHLAVILSMFLVEYKHSKLSTWSKSVRLGIVNEIQDSMRRIQGYNIQRNNVYTYCMTGSITRQDVSCVETVFNFIIDRVKNMNVNMGTISYSNYTNVRGPETINASVRLSSMHVNWTEEIAHAEEAKKAALEGEQTEDTDG